MDLNNFGDPLASFHSYNEHQLVGMELKIALFFTYLFSANNLA